LARSREPLEAGHLTGLPQLTAAAYQRACRLAADLARCPDDAVDAALGGLRSLREVLAGDTATNLDPDLFRAALRRVAVHPPAEAQAACVGAAAGLLYGEGLLDEAELVRLAAGYLGGAVTDPRKSCGLLRGLLATAREIAWQVAEIVRALDEQFRAWDDATFLAVLPELRLAFTDLTPREVARVADRVAEYHSGQAVGELVHTDIDEGEVHVALDVTRRVRDALRADGLV